MGVTWIIVGVVTFLYFYYWYRRPKNFPPGPRGIPLLGVTIFLKDNIGKKLKKWSRSYGPIMTVRMGTEDQVSLNNYDVIMQALVKQSTVYSGRPSIPLMDQITNGNGLIFTDYGDKWKSQRKFGLTTLRGFGLGKKSMESRINEEVDYLNDSIRSENGKAFGISTLLKYAVSNIISNLVFGKRFEYDDSEFQEVIRKIIEGFSDPTTNNVANIMIMAPWLMHTPPFSYFNKKFVNDYKVMLNFFEKLINEHEDTFEDEELRDFIDAFIKEMKKGHDSYFSKQQLMQYIDDLFEAGTETTSSTLCWCLLCCLHYPQAQGKLREEIMRVIGAEGSISMSRRNEMPYTNAFIQEILRYRTLAPWSVFHKTTENTEIGGYSIPKGTTIIPNLWAVHNDPELFEEPEKFKPERFLDEKGNYLSSNHVIPFSVGPRHCLGEQLARMELFIFLVGMIRKFEFLPDPSADQLPDIEDGSSGFVFTPNPYKIVAKLI